MLFNSWTFLAFLIVVWTLYLHVGHRAQNRLLLIASYVFYGWWDPRFTLLMFGSTLIDYVCALRIVAEADASRRRRWVVTSVVSHLVVLGFFKYFNFFTETAEQAFGQLGVPVQLLHLHLVLPVGLSFYTFKSMSYTIDVYRGQIAPTRRFLDFALFVSFFPQLVAGPIERASELLPQVLRPRPALEADDLRVGAYLIGWGLFKKVIVGDGCARLVNTVFADHGAFSGLDHLVALYAFAFQIYGDFSGYSDMAVGVARLFGFHLVANFNLPYFATNPSDLWRRWHISLSSWLRDYLYIPLGGNRGGPIRTYRNLIVTMGLGGLWHGAQWTMVMWGLYHGVALAVHRLVGKAPGAASAGDADRWRILKIVGMFQVTCLGWLLFRASSLGQVRDMLVAIGTDLRVTDFTVPALVTLVQLTSLLVSYEIAQYVCGHPWLALRWSPERRMAFGLVVVYSAALYWMLNRSLVQSGQPFIYFQF